MKKILITLFLLFVSIQISAKSPLSIKAEIFSGEVSLGAPTLLVNQNTDTSVVVEGSYNLTLNATETDNNTIFIKAIIKAGGVKHSPSLLVEFGKEAMIKVGNTTLTLMVNK